jgi:phenylpropionate dioxygenase-like ring-hydroxylating dioxygenase large terminal subunit
VDPGGMIDNFLDVAHFPFVHAATFGTPTSDRAEEYEVTPTQHGFVAVTEHDFANHEDPAVADGLRPLVQRRRMTYTYVPPFSATLTLDYLDAGGTNLILFAIQPERAGVCRVHTVLFRNDVGADEMPAALEFEQRVLDEDLAIQTLLTTTLPLDLTVEVHTKADRLTLELRRCLARFLAPPPAAR